MLKQNIATTSFDRELSFDALVDPTSVDIDYFNILPDNAKDWVLSEFERTRGTPLVLIYRKRVVKVERNHIISIDDTIGKPHMRWALNAVNSSEMFCDRATKVDYHRLIDEWHLTKERTITQLAQVSAPIQRWLDAREKTPTLPTKPITKADVPKPILPRRPHPATSIIRAARATIANIGLNLVSEQPLNSLSPYGHIRCELRTFIGSCVLVIDTANDLVGCYQGRLATANSEFHQALADIFQTKTLKRQKARHTSGQYSYLTTEKFMLSSSADAMLGSKTNDPAREFGDLADDLHAQVERVFPWTIVDHGHGSRGIPQTPYGHTYAVSLTHCYNTNSQMGYWNLAIFNRSQ